MKAYSSAQIEDFINHLRAGKTLTTAAELAGCDPAVLAQRNFAGRREPESPYRLLARQILAAKIDALKSQLEKLGGTP
jgi:hypothetical protein